MKRFANEKSYRKGVPVDFWCEHTLITAGENTTCFVYWCTKCGALVDEDGETRIPNKALPDRSLYKHDD